MARTSSSSGGSIKNRGEWASPRFGLVAVDLDGTLLNSQKEISDRNRTALARAEAAGVALAFISGRRFAELELLTAGLSGAAFRVGHGGALIRRGGRTIAEFPLPKAAAERAARAALRLEIPALISERDGSVRITAHSPVTPRVQRYLRTVRPAPRFDPDPTFVEDPLHLVIAGTPETCREAERELAEALGDSVSLARTEYAASRLGLLDVLAGAANKGTALARIAGEAGLPLSATMAIGDNWNDLEMLEAAGVGVLMGNAEAGLKTRGFENTASHDEDGVAAAIDRLLLSE
ncbi:MAG: HAD-IIB family hydrolase [Acidobacteria bacterium]|nr:HAD-IIB family hydrolase [Acidobacteriota bacterium]